MDLTQIAAIFGSVTVPMSAGVFAFYKITQGEISVIREQTNAMDKNHREDMNKMDARWEKSFEKMDAKMSHMEEKWEHLYEKYFEGKQGA